jgi:hypothetical protein
MTCTWCDHAATHTRDEDRGDAIAVIPECDLGDRLGHQLAHSLPLEIGDRVLRLVDGTRGTVTSVRTPTDYEVAWDEEEAP